MPALQTRALILRHTTDREHDRMLVVLTPEHGQMRLRARGTKKSVSKLGGSLEPLTEVDLQLAHGRTFDVITGSVIHNRFPEARSEVVKLVAAQWFLELVERVTKPDQVTQPVYGLVVEELHRLGTYPNRAGHVWLGLLRSAWRLLDQEGFVPNPTVCGICGRAIKDEDVVFEPQRGFVHQSESTVTGIGLEIGAMQFLATGETPTDVRSIFRQIHPLVEQIVHTTLDQPLRSDRVLQHVIRLEQLSDHQRRATLQS